MNVQIVLPPHLERIREKLAENIHELWVMNKIELGWTFGTVSIRQKADERMKKQKQNKTQQYGSVLMVVKRHHVLVLTLISVACFF